MLLLSVYQELHCFVYANESEESSLYDNCLFVCRVSSCHLILYVSFAQAPWKRICVKILLMPWTSTRQPLMWTPKPVFMMRLHFTFKLCPIYCTFIKLVNELDKFVPIDSKKIQYFGFRPENSEQYSRNLPVRINGFSESFISSVALNCFSHISIICIHKNITLEGYIVVYSS